MGRKEVRKDKCTECGGVAAGYINKKPYCAYHYERIWYKTKMERKHQNQLNEKNGRKNGI